MGVYNSDLRIKVVQTLDELSSYLGLIKSQSDDGKIVEQLESIQKNLIKFQGEIEEHKDLKGIITERQVTVIENWIDFYEKMCPKNKKIVLPGLSSQSATIDIAKTVARRAERYLVQLSNEKLVNENLLIYLNRLSDYLYILARYIDFINIIIKNINDLKPSPSKVKENKLNLETSKKLIETIEKKANLINIPVVITVCNKEGNIIAVHCMDDALIASFDVAVNKAYTSIALKMSTKELGELSQPGQPLYGIQSTNQGRIVQFGGGVPLIYKEQIIGGLGVSGGSVEQDTKLADYGAEIITQIVGR